MSVPDPDAVDARRLVALGGLLIDRFRATGARDDLARGIEALGRAIAASEGETRQEAEVHLAGALLSRYNAGGDLADVDRAIGALTQIAEGPATGRIGSFALEALAVAVHTRAEVLMRPEDIDRSIALFSRLLDEPEHGALDRRDRVTNLAEGLRLRYHRTGDLADLMEALSRMASVWPDDPLVRAQPRLAKFVATYALIQADAYTEAHLEENGEAALAAIAETRDSGGHDAAAQAFLDLVAAHVLMVRYSLERRTADAERAAALASSAVGSSRRSPYDRALALSTLGFALLGVHDGSGRAAALDEAIDAFEEALLAEGLGMTYRSRWCAAAGAARHARYRDRRAAGDLERSIALLEAALASLPEYAPAVALAYGLRRETDRSSVATTLVCAYLDRAEATPGGHSEDRRRAMTLSETLKVALVTATVDGDERRTAIGDVPASLREEECALRLALNDLDRAEFAAYTTLVRPGDEGRADFASRRADLADRLEEVWSAIRVSSPAGAALIADWRRTFSWTELETSAARLGSGTALVSVTVASHETALLVWRDGRDEVAVARSDELDAAGWLNLGRRYDRELRTTAGSRSRGETWDLELRRLVAALAEPLRGVDRLVVSPSGPSHAIPWALVAERAGILTPTGTPAPVVTVPSLDDVPSPRALTRNRARGTVVVGDPNGDLPFAADEARRVAFLFGAEPLLGADAERATVMSRLAQAGHAHLAAHGAPAGDGGDIVISLHDGALSGADVSKLRVDLTLLVLSGCDTGQVDAVAGEQFAGLAHAFLQAGARSLVVTLWPVADPVAADVTAEFYAAALRGVDLDESLRRATLPIRQDARYAHPYYWAGWVLMGDWHADNLVAAHGATSSLIR